MSDVTTVDPTTAAKLKQYIERIESIGEEIKASQEDQKDVYSEAKLEGFDTKIMRMIVSARAKDKAAREEEEALYDTYKAAIGL